MVSFCQNRVNNVDNHKDDNISKLLKKGYNLKQNARKEVIVTEKGKRKKKLLKLLNYHRKKENLLYL